MEGKRRQYALLLGLALILVAALYRAWPSSTSVAPSSSSNQQGQRAAGRVAKAEAPDVHLNALETERPKPAQGERNLFRFRPKAPPPPPPSAPRAPDQLPPGVLVTGPPPPPPPAPITLKFIGIVDTSASAAKIAVLSDGHNVFHGREGDIIEGRFRILHIGAESIEMTYLDGRGRQSIRLTGS